MQVSLFVTCLVDQFWPSVGRATVTVLRRAGCQVAFDPRQTCCAQPAFNAGYLDEARRVAKSFIEVFERSKADAIVTPSGSCCAMLHRLRDLFEDDAAWRVRAGRVAEQTHELGSFLVDVLGVDDLGARYEGRVSWHDACHGLRDLGIKDQPRRLIRNVEGTELVELPDSDAESCCGFGGTFSVKYPEISVAILDRKLEALRKLEIDAVVSGDVSCLMQIGGRLQRQGSPIATMHLAELLARGAS
ncbi:MAG: (Fe-S)-binding protein [Planctomycetota bacterium]|nr:(Fe-S)-binding protein [Planctomycetota bacterium]